MTEAPSPSQEDITEFLEIEQESKKYLLVIKIKNELMILDLSEEEEPGNNFYSKKLTLKELKEKEENKIFSLLNSCKEFADYLKTLSERKKIAINKMDNKLSINFVAEYLLKSYPIEIDLFPKKNNFDLIDEGILKEFGLMKEKIKYLENKNKELEEEIKEIKNIIGPMYYRFKDSIYINRYIFNNNSVIMKQNEFDLIHLAIKSRLNKEVKELKKLYQASIDGDGAFNFHSKCDNIPNTLTFIKSAGNRRFGGFTSQTWDSSSGFKDDKNAFLFSLDKQKIYSYKNDKKAIDCNAIFGPCFGDGHTIYIGPNAIQEKKLFTYESNPSCCSYYFYDDKNALSERPGSYCYTTEYEVFQVIFKE